MLNSSVLDVAIGVVFGFLAISLVTSAIVEAINSMFKLRAASLLSGVKALVNDPALVTELYAHASVNPRGSIAEPLAHKPAYIDPPQFASAFLDIIGISAAAGANPGPGATTAAAFTTAINSKFAATNPQMQTLLQGIVDRNGGNIALVREDLAAWFDHAMDRVGGGFKRQTQLMSFLVALLAAILLNVDALHLAMRLWQQPMLASQMKLPTAPNIVDVLNGNLPAGWPPGHFLASTVPNAASAGQQEWQPVYASTAFFSFMFGCLITAIATLFGAPFWFDVLQSFVQVKGSGAGGGAKGRV